LVHAQHAWWNQEFGSPLETLITGYRRSRDQQIQGRLDLGVLEFAISSVAVLATIAAWRLLPRCYALFATVFCLIVLSSGWTGSIWRHVFMIFPLFMVAALAGRYSAFDPAYVAGGLVVSGLFFTLVATGWAPVA
jgi:hypothetical protein